MKLGNQVLPKQKSRVGILFAEEENRNELEKRYQQFMNRNEYLVG